MDGQQIFSMDSSTPAITSIKPMTVRATGKHLTRGIDEIPAGWELASGVAALEGLGRAMTTLSRLIDETKPCDSTRGLKLARTACSRALNHLSGGFDRAYIAPKAAAWEREVNGN
jgi:hypothetical protein